MSTHDPLTPRLCEQLLRAGVVGRLGVSAPDGVHVITLNYAVLDDAVVMRTTPDSVIGRHAPGSVAAFHIDHVEYDYHRGWSVQARGPVEVVAEDAAAAIERYWLPQPWAGGERPLLLALRWKELTGRRLGAGWDPWERLPVRRVR